MNTNSAALQPLLASLAETVLPLLPTSLRASVAGALPELAVPFERLGLEVLDAEQQGIGYSKAVRQTHFPMMARVYFGAADVLRWRLPASVRAALSPLLQLAADGSFEPVRRLLFLLARDRQGREAAVGRFLLWCALVINLRVHTWDYPQAEAFGALKAMEEESESRLKELLADSVLDEPEVRPLHVLVAGLLEQTRMVTEDLWRVFLEETGSGLGELVQITEALRQTRRLDVRDAMAVEPRLLEPDLGSQQTVDRHPHIYQTVGALENQRSRALRKMSAGEYDYSSDRLIDMLRNTDGSDK